MRFGRTGHYEISKIEQPIGCVGRPGTEVRSRGLRRPLYQASSACALSDETDVKKTIIAFDCRLVRKERRPPLNSEA